MPTPKSFRGFTPLRLAAGFADNPYVIRALVEGGTDVSVRDSTNSTSLHYAAAFNRHDSIVKVLLTLGADVSARDKMGVAPFHAAAALNPDVQRLVLLLQYGALLDTCDAKGITPLLSAASAHGEPRGRALPAEKGPTPGWWRRAAPRCARCSRTTRKWMERSFCGFVCAFATLSRAGWRDAFRAPSSCGCAKAG
ncbi:ankyrin repeat domain-containing protein [Oceanithermus sp.]